MARLQFQPLTSTPWADASELPQIRSIIYQLGPNAPPAEDRRQQAVDLLEAWKMRGRLPHAMDATCLLLNAIVNSSRADVTTLSARSVYAVAWARFVTGYCDSGKEMGMTKRSMFAVAREIGMPSHFVELRHEIGHFGLPNMQRLAKAAEHGMDWLWSRFWTSLDSPEMQIRLHPTVLPTVASELIEAALSEFRKARKVELLNTGHLPSKDSASSSCASKLLGLVEDEKDGALAIVAALVKVGFIVPKKRELGASMDLAFTFWDPLLLQLSQISPSFMVLLTRRIVQTTLYPTSLDVGLDSFREALREWTNHILTSSQWSDARTRNNETLRGEVVRICHGASGPFAEKLAKIVIEADTDSISTKSRKRKFKP